MYQNVTIDLETLDTETTAKILSIGLVPWNPGEQVSFQELCERESSLYIKIELDSYWAFPAFTESEATIEFWDKQGEQARHVLEPDALLDTPITQALDQVKAHLKQWVEPLRRDQGLVFCRGYDFDGGILEHAFHQCRFVPPWGYNRFRCIRTVIDTIANTRNGYVTGAEPEGFIKHHALHDAAMDTLTVLTLTQA